MGEAKRRREAEAAGRLMVDPRRCPACGGRNTEFKTLRTMSASLVATRVGICACGSVWEAYPDDWEPDPAQARPCDNCAFRPSSPEITNREEWQALLAKLRAGGTFSCHKGAPMLIVPKDDGSGGFTAEFDEDWIKQHGRLCAGFCRARDKWPEWMRNRLSAVPHLPEGGGA